MSRVLLTGDSQAAGSLLGFAKKKANRAPAPSSRTYTFPDGSYVRVHKDAVGRSHILIHGGGATGYQFSMFSGWLESPRRQASAPALVNPQGAIKVASPVGQPYEGENGGYISAAATGSQESLGGMYLNTWWGFTGASVTVPTANVRYQAGMLSYLVRAPQDYLMVDLNGGSFLTTQSPVVKKKGSKRVTVIDTPAGGAELAGAYTPLVGGGSALVFVYYVYDTVDPAKIGFAIRNPDGSFVIQEVNLPAWAEPANGKAMAVSYWSFSRDGTKVIGVIDTSKDDIANEGVELVCGFVEFELEATDNDGVIDLDVTLIDDEYMDDRVTRILGADYRWDGDTDTRVILKLTTKVHERSISHTATMGTGSTGDDETTNLTYLVYRSEYEWYEQGNTTPYRTKIAAHAVGLSSLSNAVTTEAVPTYVYEDVIGPMPSNMHTGQIFDDIAAVAETDYGYTGRYSTLIALDLRADAYALYTSEYYHEAPPALQSSELEGTPHGLEWECFGAGEVEDTVGEYATINPADYVEMTEYHKTGSQSIPLSNRGGQLTNFSANDMSSFAEYMFNISEEANWVLIGSAYGPDVIASSPPAGFFAIHPGKHFAVFANLPRVHPAVFLEAREVTSGGSRVALDRISMYKGDDSEGAPVYNSITHAELVESAKEEDNEFDVGDFFAIAAAGIWAI